MPAYAFEALDAQGATRQGHPPAEGVLPGHKADRGEDQGAAQQAGAIAAVLGKKLSQGICWCCVISLNHQKAPPRVRGRLQSIAPV